MFPNLPDNFFHTLFALAVIGLAVCGIGALWLAYHIVRAGLFYIGVLT